MKTISERDLEIAKNILKRVSHRPIQEKESILREWFGKKASPDFIKEAITKATEKKPTENPTKPIGKITLIRHILGAEVYRDENNIEWVALPNGDLVINKPL